MSSSGFSPFGDTLPPLTNVQSDAIANAKARTSVTQQPRGSMVGSPRACKRINTDRIPTAEDTEQMVLMATMLKESKGLQHPCTLESIRGASAVKTFNKESLRVETLKGTAAGIPKRSTLIRKKYKSFLENAAKVTEAEQHVDRLSLREKMALALQSLRRRHREEWDRMVRRGVFSDEVARERANVLFRIEVDNTIGHINSDTKELSVIRIHNAAADAILFNEAQRLADVEIQQFLCEILPDSVTPVDVLELSLDAYRQAHVPHPPRRLLPETARHTSRVGRRSSFRGVFATPQSQSIASPIQPSLDGPLAPPPAVATSRPARPRHESVTINTAPSGTNFGGANKGGKTLFQPNPNRSQATAHKANYREIG